MAVKVHKQETTKELLDAYKNFGCQLISTTYEVLALWAQTYKTYGKTQLAELQQPLATLESLEIYEVYCFFYLAEGQKHTGLESLIKGFELTLTSEPFVAKAKPLLQKSFYEMNFYRRTHGLPTISFPDLDGFTTSEETA